MYNCIFRHITNAFETRKLIKFYRCALNAEYENKNLKIKQKNVDSYINEEEKKKKLSE